MSAAAERTRVTLTINEFIKTVEGKTLVRDQVPFVLGGQTYQGYNGVPIDVPEKQMTDAEIEAAPDVDGTKDRIWFKRKQRLQSRELSRKKEMDERERIARQKRRDELELQKLERELAPEPPAPVADVEAACSCPKCGKEFENQRKLQGHMMGAHRE